VQLSFTTMSEFTGINYYVLNPENPTLEDLIVFTKRHRAYFIDLDLTVLAKYETNSREPWAKGRYYLYGQLPVLTDTPITRQLLNDAQSICRQREIDYGGPCNSIEVASMAQATDLYNKLVLIIDRYRLAYDDVMYAPGTGIEFLRAKAHFDQSQGLNGTK
jgi:hypothetical protein